MQITPETKVSPPTAPKGRDRPQPVSQNPFRSKGSAAQEYLVLRPWWGDRFEPVSLPIDFSRKLFPFLKAGAIDLASLHIGQ